MNGTAPRRTPLDPWIAEKLGVALTELTPESLEAFQLQRLRATLDWVCQKSPYYRARLATDGRPPRPEALSALARLPFTTADDLRAHGGQLLCVSQDEVARVVTLQSSGTTGPPKRLHFTREDQEATLDFFHHGMSTLVGPGDRVAVLLPGGVSGSVGALLASALRRLGVTPVPHGFVRELPRALEVLQREGANSLVGTPVQALALARYASLRGVHLELRTVLLTTDHVPDAIVRTLAREWGCEVFEHYGMTEMGLGGAVDCAAHAGYHLRAPELLFEIIDPATGQPLPVGTPGEVVFTTLSRRGMPLLRYRTGDRSRMLPGPCPCGSPLPRLERVRGRLAEGPTRAGPGEAPEVSTPVLDELLFPIPGVVDYRATLCRGPSRAQLSVTALSLRPEGALIPAVEAALDGSATIGPAWRSGRIAVTVASEALGDRLLRGPEKRSLEVLEVRDGE